MKLTDIVSITGISGLHKIIGRTKSGLIVESLVEVGKRFPTSMQDKVSVLDDISMYTENGDMKLSEVLGKIHDKGDVPTSKEESTKQRQYLIDVIQLDSERVYDSDIKKLLNWYHILSNVIDIKSLIEEDTKVEEVKEEATPVVDESNTDKEPVKPKKTAAKKVVKKTADGETTVEKPKATRKKKTEN